MRLLSRRLLTIIDKKDFYLNFIDLQLNKNNILLQILWYTLDWRFYVLHVRKESKILIISSYNLLSDFFLYADDIFIMVNIYYKCNEIRTIK